MEQQPTGDVCTPYQEALQERMLWPAAEQPPEAVTKRDRVLSLKRDADGMLVAVSMSGCEVVRCSVPPDAPVQVLRREIAGALGVPASTIAVFTGDCAMADAKVVSNLEAVLVKQIVEQATVFVCRRPSVKHDYIGEGSVSVSLPDVPLLQVVREPLHYVTGRIQECWLVYSRECVTAVSVGRNPRRSFFSPIGAFPDPPAWPLPPGTRRWGSRCDVWSTSVLLRAAGPLLDKRAAQTKDRPIPRYQMIVDPNQFVRGDGSWVACEADISADGSAQLVGGQRSHVQPKLASEVAVPVLTAALPLLARLQRPQLLLERRRLQFVFKAQRIIVPPCSHGNADAEYIGLWHVDGYLEPVVAVVLYYYKVDPMLQGGDMEFCGKEPMDVLGYGDCSGNNRKLSAETLRASLRGDAAVARTCRVPIKQGTLLVFSNYQMVHRVLRMVNKSKVREASRDFVALFIVDPAAKPLVPARIHLARPYLMARTLEGKTELRVVRRLLEFLGEVPTKEHKRQRRAQLLRQQLKPQGRFQGNNTVYATGNGCYSMIGWLDSMLQGQATHDGYFEVANPEGWRRLRALNLPPEKLGRGMSEVLSLSSGALEDRELGWEAVGDMIPAVDGVDD